MHSSSVPWAPDRGSSLINLSVGLMNRFKQTGQAHNLEEYIQLNREGLLLHPVGHPDRGHLEDLDESIKLNRDALLLHPMGHPGRGSSLVNLSLGILNRFKQTGHLQDLEEYIQLNRDALLLHAVGHPARGPSLNNLSLGFRHRFEQTGHLEDLDHVGLLNRFEQTGHLEDLDESIQVDRDALLLHPVGHPHYGSALNNLGVGLWNRFHQTGHLQDLEESIQLDRDALLLHPSGLGNRFEQIGNVKDLEESIQLDRDALLLYPVGHPRHSYSLNNLGAGLWNRFHQTGHLQDLEESIQLQRGVLLLRPVGHPDRGSSLDNLGQGLRSRFKQTGRLKDLGAPDRCSSLINLSVGLLNCFQQTGHLEDLDESIQLNRDALLLLPMEHPTVVLHSITSVWASAIASSREGIWKILRSLFSWIEMHFYFVPWGTQPVTGHLEDLTECLSCSKQAANDLYSPVSDCLVAVQNWVKFTQPYPDLAQSTWMHMYRAFPHFPLTLHDPSISLQYQHLLSVIRLPEFVSDAASQAIQLGQLSLAVEIIEQGRVCSALVDELTQINHRLEILSMQNSLTEVQGQVEATRDQFGHSLSEKRRLLQSQSDIVGRIHKIPGFETFLDRKSFGELKSAGKHGPVILVNCKDLYEQVETLVQQLTEARSDIKAAPKRYNHVLQDTLKDLWELVVFPVVTKLRELHIPEKSRIFWCPTSILSTLPIHAAGPVLPGTKKFLPDLYISSYTPTLTALIDAFSTKNQLHNYPIF
ncbi:hypothetical protein BDP27DRAFT_1451436 [Rhodocollybia butyracea]|uniref:Uncharacterized protein n=1 Tax=Rhodocollybia butyracea TaxID=206335 RepID=A0A9P5U0Z9_9AGAR|nr:hypothetical protein BDP27DRAFT_1451436 [Rhodocollybia butyracea]